MQLNWITNDRGYDTKYTAVIKGSVIKKTPAYFFQLGINNEGNAGGFGWEVDPTTFKYSQVLFVDEDSLSEAQATCQAFVDTLYN